MVGFEIGLNLLKKTGGFSIACSRRPHRERSRGQGTTGNELSMGSEPVVKGTLRAEVGV